MKVLNLYACLGGNRLLWEDCEVTAVELDPELARMYQERFPNDTVIVGDAHQYLLEHYKKFDFIWSSPPCPTHSRARFWSSKGNPEVVPPVYPDMKLYQEIIFLQNFVECKWVVENVIPYYTPLIPSQKRGRHLYWSNFILPSVLSDRKDNGLVRESKLSSLGKYHDYDFTKYKGNQRVLKIARNLVDYKAGETIFNTAKGIFKDNNINQGKLF